MIGQLIQRDYPFWRFEEKRDYPLPIEGKYTEIMYFEDFKSVGLLHKDGKTITDIPLSKEPIDINNQDLLAKFLRKKGVAKNPFG